MTAELVLEGTSEEEERDRLWDLFTEDEEAPGRASDESDPEWVAERRALAQRLAMSDEGEVG